MCPWIRHTSPTVETGLTLKRRVEGTINANSSEQTLAQVNSLLKLSGYIDLSNMEDGDEVIIKQRMRVKPGGNYKQYAKETYVGVQENPLIYITTKVLGYGGKITLQQTGGSLKSFDYEFISEE